MKVNIKRIDNSLPMPQYATSGSVCFDLYSRLDITIKPREVYLVPTNFIIQVPEGYFLLVAPRSSTPVKKGLLIPNGIGIIDQDFHGPEDEILFEAYNFTEQEVPVKRGERLAQATLIPIQKAEFTEVNEMKKLNRGGFGSTGRLGIK